jgi:hypothetical protein
VSCYRQLIISGVVVLTGDKLIASINENPEQGLVTGVNDTGNNLYIAGVIDTGGQLIANTKLRTSPLICVKIQNGPIRILRVQRETDS